MKMILFRIGQDWQHRIRLGETTCLIQASYFRAKQLGYDDKDIYFEWPQKVAFSSDYRKGVYFQCPRETILPLNFINRDEVNLDDYDEVIDFCIPDSLYEGFTPLYDGDADMPSMQVISNIGFMNYINKYYYDTGKRPEFHIPKDKLEKECILFHIRIADWKQQRNPNLSIYKHMIKLIKESYMDKYDYFKIGEPCRGLDGMFDSVFPYFNDDYNKLLKIINNCSLFICCASGPNSVAEMLGTPFIQIDSLLGDKGFRTEEFWKRHEGVIGKTGSDWMDNNRFLIHFKGNPLDKDKILEFADRFL